MPALSCTDSSRVPTPDKLHIRFCGNQVSQAASLHGLDPAVILGPVKVTLVYKGTPESDGWTLGIRHFQGMGKGPAQSCCCCGGRGLGVGGTSRPTVVHVLGFNFSSAA